MFQHYWRADTNITCTLRGTTNDFERIEAEGGITIPLKSLPRWVDEEDFVFLIEVDNKGQIQREMMLFITHILGKTVTLVTTEELSPDAWWAMWTCEDEELSND